MQVRKAVGTPLEQAYETYSYTPNGKQEYVIDANGNRAKFEYDGFDRLANWIFPSTTQPSGFNGSTQATALASAGQANNADYEGYGYDANGNRTGLRKRDGTNLYYAYDALNRMTVKSVPGRGDLPASATRSVYYGYDLQGHQTYARFDSATGEGVTNSWDGFGRQTASTLTMDGVSRTVSYQYDADGNRTQVAHPDGLAVNYTYDGLDRQLKTRAVLGASTLNMNSLIYNDAGELATDSNIENYSYDGIGRMQSYAIVDVLNTGLGSTTTLGYNPASQLTSETRTNNAYAFTGTYNVNRGYSVNGLNQYTAAGAATFAYDANGNLTSDGATTFLYDVENRLVAASGAHAVSLRYDPLGRLYETVGASGTTRFLYDGDVLIAEYDAGGNLLRRYVHAVGEDTPQVWLEGGGLDAFHDLFRDHHGSVVSILDFPGHRFVANAYDEYGIPNSTNIGRFQYTGQAWMPDLGMYYYKARMYSPTLGRFMQADPIGYKDQSNLYAYVANDPVNHEDPTGEFDPTNFADFVKLAGAEEVVGGGPEDPVADVAAVVTLGVGLLLSSDHPASGDADRARAARTDAAEGRDRTASEGRQSTAGKAAAPDSLKAGTPVGSQVKTPANSPGSFTKLKGGQGFKDNKTGMIFQNSHTNHSNSPGGEFKAGPRPGVPPTPGTKVTISGGPQGGCVLKKDGC